MRSHLRVLVIIICLSNIQFAAFQNIPDPEEINSKEFLLSDLKEDEVFDYQSIGNLKKNAGNSLSTLITIQMSSANLTDIIKSIARENKINFVYDDRLLNIRGVTINYEDKPLYELLDEILSIHNISYYEFAPGEIALAKQIRIDETTGGIKGNIKNEKNEKLFGTNILIRELGVGTTSDVNGNFSLRNIKPGEYTLEISYMGYEKIIRKIKITAGILLEQNFILKETAFLIGGIEVTGTRDLIPTDSRTKTTITSGEIEHYQASSIKDVLDLVPGVQKTSNPGLGKTSQVALRGNELDNSSTFGTLVVIDGAPVSNNANMQFEKPFGANFGSNNMVGGVDLRTIPADNIQNIEITTGLPSVKYGDATSGVINIKSKTGVSPNRLKLKNNPDTREGNFEGGFRVGEGSLSYNLNAAQSEREVRVTGDEYLRLTGQVVYSKKFFDNALTTNNKISYQRIFDEEEPKEDLRQTRNYNRSYSVSLSSWGTYKDDDGVSSLDYNLYTTMRKENSMRSKLVTDYVIIPSGDTLTSYIGQVETKGIEWTLGGRLEYNDAFYTGDIIHKILVGIEPQYNANTGEGVVFDTLLSFYGQGTGRRPRSFDEIPGQFLLGAYFEDKITGHMLFDFSLMVGFRYEMYRPTKFNLSGLWGDGDLIESHQGTFFNPRLNLMVYFSKVNQFRLSIGNSSKSPPMSRIYPQVDVMPWRNPYTGNNLYIRNNLYQPDLKGYREAMCEVAYDHKLFNSVGVTASAYFKQRKGSLTAGLSTPATGYTIPVFVITNVNNKYTAFYVDEYTLPANIGKMETKGLEFSVRTAKIDALNMDFNITGSYSYTKYFAKGNNYSSTPDASKGQYPNYQVPEALVDTLIGWTYPRGEKWYDRLQLNYSVKYTLPSLGLWITLRAEQLLFVRSRDLDHAPIDFNVAGTSVIASYLFDQEIKREPNKWLFSFNMSKSLFKGAEVSFYVNNFFDDPAILRKQLSLTSWDEKKRNPDLFYGIEFSMMFDSLTK
ncbi:MAG: TonB-dependent receptor [Ignavibacteriales bacterium]|nr:TonB-dependent receptor [Ignavibacteriales bacterium]